MYLSHDKNTFQCHTHNSLCNSVCYEALCPKNGFLCQECTKLDIHKHHFKKICTIQQLVDSLLVNLKGDNLQSSLQEIQTIQKTFWDLSSFFVEHNVPSLFSLETILAQTKELFWNRMMFYSTSDFSHNIRELNQQSEQEKTQGLVSLLNSYHLSATQILTNDIRAYFDANLLNVIEEFKDLLKPYQNFVQNLGKNLIQDLSKAWRVKDSIKLSYGILDPRSYNHLLTDLQDQQHIAYFDWKSIYFYNYQIQKVTFTITTQDPINGIVYLKDKFQIISLHNGGMLQSCGLNVWDIQTGKNVLSAENNRNIYNLLYLKKQNMLIYDSDDAYGNNYHLRVFDFRVKKAIKTLCIPFLIIADELSFKYYENKNIFIVQISLDATNPLSELYDCIFQTYECLHFRKIHSFELKVHDELYKNTKILPKVFKELENIFVTKCNHHLIFYDPGSKIPILIFQPASHQEEIFELGGIVCSPKQDFLLIGCKRHQGFQTINSILIYDTRKNQIVAETENLFNALNMGLVILEKGELILAANYDSTLQFLRKNFWTN